MAANQPPKPDATNTEQAPATRRRYNSPLRQQQAAETRQRLIDAGVELVHELPDWDWKNLTFQAVGQRAGISERTAYRHFSSERLLRDAVMEQLVTNSGIDLSQLSIDNFKHVTTDMFAYLSSFAVAPDVEEDPTFASMDQERRDAVQDAVVRATPSWAETDQQDIAAAFDLLWNLPPYERLVTGWGFEPERASKTIEWLIELVNDAVKQGRKPSDL